MRSRLSKTVFPANNSCGVVYLTDCWTTQKILQITCKFPQTEPRLSAYCLTAEMRRCPSRSHERCLIACRAVSELSCTFALSQPMAAGVSVTAGYRLLFLQHSARSGRRPHQTSQTSQIIGSDFWYLPEPLPGTNTRQHSHHSTHHDIFHCFYMFDVMHSRCNQVNWCIIFACSDPDR